MMASEQKIAANRNNAKKSTGPHSKRGREVSRHNALRHGLAVSIGADPAFHHDIEKLAKALSLEADPRKVSESERVAAEAQLDLLRIRKTRAWLFATLYFARDAPLESLTKLNDELAKLERYERRAFSKRRRALQLHGPFGLN
jgi:hypothetical protein